MMEVQRNAQVLGRYVLRHCNSANSRSLIKPTSARYSVLCHAKVASSTCTSTVDIPWRKTQYQNREMTENVEKSNTSQICRNYSNTGSSLLPCHQCNAYNPTNISVLDKRPADRLQNISYRSFSSSSCACQSRKDMDTGELEPEHLPTDLGMNLRLHIENGYLSYMRNSYIMTLAGITMINFDVGSMGMMAGGGTLLISGLNLTVGSLGFLYNLSNLRKREHMSGLMCRMMQFWAFLHYVFWYAVLVLLFPEFSVLEEEALAEEEKLKRTKDL